MSHIHTMTFFVNDWIIYLPFCYFSHYTHDMITFEEASNYFKQYRTKKNTPKAEEEEEQEKQEYFEWIKKSAHDNN